MLTSSNTVKITNGRLILHDRICLITDAMRGADMPDRSCFAGSVATTDRLVRVWKEQVEIPLPEAIRMITRTPARAHEFTHKGELKEGFDADIVLFDENINIEKIMLSNRETVQIYETGEL